MRDRFLRALAGEEVDARPIWLMRQAGRYLPGYRRLRELHPILELARTPELAAEITLEPVRRFDVDAGVVYADISLPFTGLGVNFTIDPGIGPVIAHPIRSMREVDGLRAFDAERDTGYVGDAIRRFHDAGTDRPIVGFAGGPFTLASYLIEGGPSRDYAETKRLLYHEPAAFDRLISRLTEMTIAYLAMQARAGANALQIFDSWVGAVSARTFREHLAEPLRQLFAGIAGSRRPTIYFSTASSHLLEEFAGLGASAIGVDWREPLGRVRARLGDGMAIQGNLDPGALLGDRATLEREAIRVLDELPDGRSHVFNLGHGVLPATGPDRVRDLVDFVHAQRVGETGR
ncbi:MAG: uroporphyrinogen decarboxylase [Thermoplasmata archaeon]